MSSRFLLRSVSLILSLATAIAIAPLSALGQGGRTTLVVLHTSDYHSHAVPKYAEGEHGVGGLARLIQYLRDEKAANPNVVILSGGDTMNLGTPAWSDKYQCAEWPLFNGLSGRDGVRQPRRRLRLGALRGVPGQRHLPDPQPPTS